MADWWKAKLVPGWHARLLSTILKTPTRFRRRAELALPGRTVSCCNDSFVSSWWMDGSLDGRGPRLREAADGGRRTAPPSRRRSSAHRFKKIQPAGVALKRRNPLNSEPTHTHTHWWCLRVFEAAVKRCAGGQVVLMNIHTQSTLSCQTNRLLTFCHLPKSDRFLGSSFPPMWIRSDQPVTRLRRSSGGLHEPHSFRCQWALMDVQVHLLFCCGVTTFLQKHAAAALVSYLSSRCRPHEHYVFYSEEEGPALWNVHVSHADTYLYHHHETYSNSTESSPKPACHQFDAPVMSHAHKRTRAHKRTQTHTVSLESVI